jgi:hypothetical protein
MRRWLPDCFIKLMGDTAYSILELGLHARAEPGHLRHIWPVGCSGNNSLRANQQRRIDEDTLLVDAKEPAV